MKGGRDNAAVQAALQQLEVVAKGTDNLMPPIMDAVRAYATLGEIADVFRGVFGKHTETVVL
jgi:methylmalonyl-CoA mutase N-terminal domain/subunit